MRTERMLCDVNVFKRNFKSQFYLKMYPELAFSHKELYVKSISNLEQPLHFVQALQ